MLKTRTTISVGNRVTSLTAAFLFSSNFRPSLTHAETIESCNSDDLVTVLKMHNRKPYKIIDRKREVKKGVVPS